MDKVGIKPGDKVLNKGIIRIQKLIDELTREMNALKARVTTLESGLTALTARVTELES